MSTERASNPQADAATAAAWAALIDQLRGPPKSRTTAVLLAVFLGFIGGHKFYLGQTGLGLLYLLFSPSLIPLLVGWVEAVIYLTQDEAEFQRKYR